MASIRRRLSFANVVSCIALFVALGGASYAATQLPKNSVGTKQIKPNAVNSSKVKNGSLVVADFKSSELSQLQGPAGAQGPKGESGAPGQLLQALPSGRTQVGAYGFASTRSEVGLPFTPAVETSYPLPISFEPTSEIVESGDAPTANCPGEADNPTAAPGFLCIYEDREDVLMSLETLPGEGHYGFILFFEAEPGEDYENYGTWAVTAP